MLHELYDFIKLVLKTVTKTKSKDKDKKKNFSPKYSFSHYISNVLLS